MPRPESPSHMRIALDFSTLDTAKPAGQYRYCVNLIRGLSMLGTDAEFLVLGSKGAPSSDIVEAFDHSCKWRYRQFRHATGRASYWLDQIKYSNLLMGERISLYHGLHDSVPFMATCPSVVTIYDLMAELFPEYEEWKRSRPYRLNRWLARRRARRIIAISASTASDISQYWKVDPGRIDVVPLGSEFLTGINAAETAGEPSKTFDANGPMILSPYNLEPRKNLQALLAAVAKLIGRHPSLRLVLFGRAAITPQREAEFDQTIADLQLSAITERTGVLTDSALAHLYRRCTVFVFPSLYEGFGLPILEAMASGACIVARNASAMAEVVGANGLLVETRDSDRLAKAIETLIENPQQREVLAQAALARARSFTIANMAELTFKSYRTALA
jgi:glycosyltransferase involved in cell wall biosynthesis